MATQAVGTLTKLYNPRSVQHLDAMKALAEGLQGMIAAGHEADAKRIYNEKQNQFGFTDEEFRPFTAGMGSLPIDGAPAAGITQWAANPDVNDGSTVTPAVVPNQDKIGIDPAPITQTQTPVITTPITNTNGDVQVRDQLTGGTNSPGVAGNQNVTGNAGSGQFGNNNISGSYNTDSHNNYNGWGTGYSTTGATGFNTPNLDALYQAQQQRMQSTAPTFNFQQKLKKGGPVRGALTRVVYGK